MDLSVEDNPKCELLYVWQQTKRVKGFLPRAALAMVKYMGRNHQIITEKRFMVAYLSFFTKVILDKPVWMGRFLVKEEGDVTKFAKRLIPVLNEELPHTGFRFYLTVDEERGLFYVALVVERPHTNVLDKSSIFSTDESFLVNKFMEEISKSPDNTITRVWAMEQVSKLPKKMSVMKAEELLQKLFTNHWLKMFNGAFAFGPRAIAELEANKLFIPDKKCSVCNRGIYCKATTVPCPKCDVRTHISCRKVYAELNKADMIQCKKCNHEGSKEDWMKEPPNKRARHCLSPVSDRAPSPQPDNLDDSN